MVSSEPPVARVEPCKATERMAVAWVDVAKFVVKVRADVESCGSSLTKERPAIVPS